MLKPGLLSIGLLVVLVGCSTASRRAGESPSQDWTGLEKASLPPVELEHVPEGPQFAPAAGNLPEPFKPHVSPSRELWIPVERWARANNLGTLREVSLTPAPTYALTTAHGLLRFQVRSRIAKWNGSDFHLGFEPQLIGGQPFLHTLDLEKNLQPLLQPFALPARTNRVVVIDPGHGGRNTGTESVFAHANEKEYTLDWARRLGQLLETNGWRVLLTRNQDADVALSNRVTFAAEHQADLFISLHFNSAAPSREQAGLETYCLTPAGMSSTLTRGYEDDPALVFPNNAFDEANFQFALNIHRALLTGAGLADRGVRRARFLGVLRGQNRPAILIEGGYLSNPREAKRIADPAFRQKLAQAVAAALIPPPPVPVQQAEARPAISATNNPQAN